jgi:hypothetical protein
MNILTKHDLIGFILDNITKRGVFRLLSDKQLIIIDYLLTFRKIPSLDQPKTFNEKLQWLKIYGGIEKYTKYVDKYKVRDFISKTVGKEFNIPLIGIWEKFEDIPFDRLPRQFVLKATHGSGYVFVCKDKSSLDLKSLKKIITKWLNENFYKKTLEIQYKSCKPQIICEIYLEDESHGLIDYKFFCFDEKPRVIELIWDRFTEHKNEVFLDFDWNILTYLEPAYLKNLPKKPENFKDMLIIAKKLSKGFPFVRVDLYSVKNKIYFGELTFTPDNGLEKYDPPEIDDQLGELMDLSKYANWIINK